MRLLLVEDDSMIGAAAQQGLRHEGHSVDWVRDGHQGEAAVAGGSYDLVLLDLGLPRKDGLTILRGWRARGNAVPVLIVTARDAVSDRVAGLDAGADDYLVKPFDLDELLARVRALQRRNRGAALNVIEHGPMQLDPASLSVTYDGRAVSLQRREFMLLHKLLESAGKVLSRAQLEESVYGWDGGVESNSLDVHIHRLRRKLYPEIIRTVRGVGYVIDPAPRAQAG